MMAQRFRSMRTPGVKDVYMTDMGCVSYMLIVSLAQHPWHGYARQVMEQAWSDDFEAKWVIVVDDDIDVYDRGQVEWALATRVQPHRDIWVTPNNQPGGFLDPSIDPAERNRTGPIGCRSSRIGSTRRRSSKASSSESSSGRGPWTGPSSAGRSWGSPARRQWRSGCGRVARRARPRATRRLRT
jgi:3-polyprenyl-4-hydroxybenzoate decarboxylase